MSKKCNNIDSFDSQYVQKKNKAIRFENKISIHNTTALTFFDANKWNTSISVFFPIFFAK